MTSPTILLTTLPIVPPGNDRRFLDKQHAFRGPRLGVQVIRDYLVRNNYPTSRVSFLDIEMLSPSDDDLRSYLREMKPEIVGLSAVLSHSYQQVKRVSKLIKEVLPATWVVVGGNLGASSHIVLRRTDVDCCIVGDGEAAFLEFANHVEDCNGQIFFDGLEKIRGLCFLDKDRNTIFSGYATKPKNEFIPMPDYDFFQSGLPQHSELISRYFTPVEKMGIWFALDERTTEPHRTRRNVAQFFTSKGCTARCTFCQRNTRGYRLADLTDIENHLENIVERFDVGFIACMDENFGSRPEFARAFADLMEKYDLLWTATGVRCVNVSREDIEYFKAKGCCSLKFGVESGSQAILDSMEKNFTIDDVTKALTTCWDNGMFSPLALMVGMPGEDDDTIYETGHFIGELTYTLGTSPKDFGFALFYALPFPGTPLYDHCIQTRLIDQSLDAEEKYLISMANGLTDKWHYLNVNGASPSAVLSWDYLVKWQAQRTFDQLVKRSPKPQSELARKWGAYAKAQRKIGLQHKLKKNRRISLFLMLTLFEKLYTSRIVRQLPKWLAYPIIRYSFYTGVLAYSLVGKAIGRPAFSMYKDRPTPKPFIRPEANEKRLKKSLRAVVNQRRVPLDSTTESARERLLIGNAN
jgi:anaerobic magnesium-protoporphyrin IX monomethyl ester cyclase